MKQSIMNYFSFLLPPPPTSLSSTTTIVLTTTASLYGVWFFVTRKAKHQSRHFGGLTAARSACLLCNFMCFMYGVSMEIVIPPEDQGVPPRLPYIGEGLVAAISPHSSFPVSLIGCGCPMFRMDDRLAAFKLRNCAASVLFYVPLLREMLLILGCRDANKRTLLKLLNEGHSIGV